MTRPRTGLPVEPEDLSARARRGSLSEAERSALERAIGASQTLAILHRVGLDFDRVLGVQPGDEKLISALADGLIDSRRKRAPSATTRRWLLLGVAATLAIAGSATAWTTVRVLRERAAAPATPSVVVPRAARVRPVLSAARAALALVESAEPPTTELPEAIDPSALAATAVGSGEAVPHPMNDASSVFSAAAAARRASDFGRARSLYLRLEREFPASSEAQLARVSLGKVLLTMGRAAEAERQFALYLGSGGSLTEEALLGRAQSLARLGRQAEEQRVWEALLHDFPSSVYAGTARQRLSALSGARP